MNNYAWHGYGHPITMTSSSLNKKKFFNHTILAIKIWFYGMIIIALLSIPWINQRYFQQHNYLSIGMMEIYEHKITSEKSALVKSVSVVPGQEVKSGELLVELTCTKLETCIKKITHAIALSKAEYERKIKLMESKVRYLKTHDDIPLSEAEIEIDLIKNEIQFNKRVFNRQMLLLSHELTLLTIRKNNLIKYAPADGIVKTVLIKPGEHIDSCSTLLSIAPPSPARITLYMTAGYHDLTIGDSVNVLSYRNNAEKIKGRVIGYGEVTELPEYLQEFTDGKIFARKVYIEIPPKNPFVNGERLFVR